MKRLLFSGFSTLLLLTTAGVMTIPAPPVIAQSAAPMVFNFSAPIITNSGVKGSTHFIRVAVIGMSLETLMVAIPAQMEGFDSIRVSDQTGKTIAANTQRAKDRVSITFNQPVNPGGYIDLEFTGIKMAVPGGQTLLYGVTAQRVGLRGEIPVGTARVEVPSYN